MDRPGRVIETYRSGGLRRTRSVRRYTDRLIRARVAAAMAPAHQYQPHSVTAATIKPAASKTSVKASPSRHHRGNPELTLWSVIGPKHHGGSSGRHARPCGSVGTPGRDLRICECVVTAVLVGLPPGSGPVVSGDSLRIWPRKRVPFI